MELTLKDQSVQEIGEVMSSNAAQMVRSKSGKEFDVNSPQGKMIMAYQEKMAGPFEQMMTVLQSINSGIQALVDKFSESVSIQQEQIQDAGAAQDLAQVGGADEEAPPGEEGGEDDRSFLQKGKDKIKGLMGAGGLKGMLIKGGLLAGLLGLAVVLKKYGRQIAEKVTPIVEGIKSFFGVFIDNIGPLFDSAIDTITEAFSGLKDIFMGLFSGDSSQFFSGIKSLFIDFPIKLVSYIGEAFFGLLEAALTAFGLDATYVKDIKEFFRLLPDKISELFKKVGDFFTVTIPEKVTEIKTAITNFFNDKIVTPIKNLWTDVGNFFTITIPEKYNEIVGNVTTFFTNIVKGIGDFFTDAKNFVTTTIPEKIAEVSKGISDKFVEIKDKIIEFAMAPFKKIKELMMGMVIGVLEAVEGLPFIGDKAKKMKEQIIAGQKIQEGATLEEATAGLSTFQTAEQQATSLGTVDTMPDGSVINPDDGKMLKIRDEDTANTMAAELSKSGQGQFQAVFDDGGYFGRKFYKIVKTGEAVTGTGNTTTGGATGGELNTESAEAAAAAMGNGGGGGVVVGGNSTQVSNNSVQHTSIDENSGVSDKSVGNELSAT